MWFYNLVLEKFLKNSQNDYSDDNSTGYLSLQSDYVESLCYTQLSKTIAVATKLLLKFLEEKDDYCLCSALEGSLKLSSPMVFKLRVVIQ